MTLLRDRTGLLVGLAVVVLLGAAAFGSWHVVVGGILHGNLGAAAFGAVLAVTAAGLLLGVRSLDRRRRGRS